MSSNSVGNHTRNKQIGLPLRGRPILSSLVWLQTELDSTQSYYHYLVFASREEKDCYRVVSVAELGFTATRTASTATVGVKQIIFHIFFYFWVRRYNKTLNDCSLVKQWVLFPSTLNVPLGFASGNIEGLGGTKLTVSLGTSHWVLIDAVTLRVDVVQSLNSPFFPPPLRAEPGRRKESPG